MSESDDLDGSGEDQGSIRSEECFHAHHDVTEGSSLSASVIIAVAAVTGKPPEEMDPLYETVDPDALDQLVASVHGDEDVVVAFTYEMCRVTVGGNGEIEVRPPTEDQG